MTITNFAYPILVGYSFGILACLALIGAFVKRGRAKDDVLLLAALGTLVTLYLIGILETHQHVQLGQAHWRWRAVATALRMLFIAFAVHDTTRVVLRLGSGRMSESDAWTARWTPYFWYAFALFFAGVTLLNHPTEQSFPGSLWISAFSVTMTLLRLLNVLRPFELDKGSRRSWLRWQPRPLPDPLITLNLSPVSPQGPLTPLITDVEASNLSSLILAVVVVVIPGVLMQFFRAKLDPGFVAMAEMIVSLALVPCFFGLIQFHARTLFFDAVVKRGILGLALGIGCAILWPLLLPSTLGPEAMTAAALIAAVAGAAWVWLYRKGDALLDQLIFHRPDYPKTLEAITAGMTKCSNEEQLTEYVTKQAAEAMRADFVEFHAQIDKPASAALRIASGDRLFGYLLCGPRYRSQPYRSGDLQFLETIGAHFGGSLQSFETQKMEELAARSELKALRAQINPHFLFNALNTLADMAHSTPEAEKTILNLARVFRFTLDSTRRETVPLREEIAFIRAYLEIERNRFESKLQFSIDVPDQLLDQPVPAMLLQPLVENAIKHGVSPKIDGGWVRVSVSPSERGLIIKVEDNGIGFDVATLQPNIGLSNVRQRVEALGGGWWLDSTPGKGTSISFEVVEHAGVAA